MERFTGWIVQDDGGRSAAGVEVAGEMMTIVMSPQDRHVGRVVRVDPHPVHAGTLLVQLTGLAEPVAFMPESAHGFLAALRLQDRRPPAVLDAGDRPGLPLPPSAQMPPPLDLTRYRSPQRLTRLTQALLLVFVVGGGLGLAAAVADYRAISAFLDDPLSLNLEETFFDANNGILGMMIVGTMVVGIAFVAWTRRLYRNSEVLGALPLRYRKGWAVWGWVLPIANYVIPFHILLDVWRGSDPAAGPYLAPGWNRAKAPRLLSVWWAVWVAVPTSTLVAALGYGSDPTSLTPYRFASAVGILTSALWLSAAVLAVFGVEALAARQFGRAEAVARASFPSPPVETDLAPAPIASRSLGLPGLRLLTAGAIAASTAVAVVGFFALDPDVTGGPGAAERDTAGDIVSAGSILLSDLGIGDCFDLPEQLTEPSLDPTDPIFGVLVVPCSEPHDAEVFAIVDLEGERSEPYPGSSVIDNESATRCFNRFWNYVGAHLHDSRLDLTWFYPQEGGWRLGDRTVLCAAYDPSLASLTASVRDSGGIADGTALPWALDVGDCFDINEETSVLNMIPCPKPHDFEVYTSVAAPDSGGDFPGFIEIDDFALEYCDVQFAAFVGVPTEQSGLESFPLTPDSYTWQLQDREVRCVLNSTNLGRLEGSMRGRGSDAGTTAG